MSKFFDIKICPLCQAPMYLKYIDGHTVAYRCTTTISTSTEYSCDGKINKLVGLYEGPHYQVEIDSSISETKQITICPPYRMTTVAGSGRTQIHKIDDGALIMETSILLPDRDPEKMAKRIKGFIIFS